MASAEDRAATQWRLQSAAQGTIPSLTFDEVAQPDAHHGLHAARVKAVREAQAEVEGGMVPPQEVPPLHVPMRFLLSIPRPAAAARPLDATGRARRAAGARFADGWGSAVARGGCGRGGAGTAGASPLGGRGV